MSDVTVFVGTTAIFLGFETHSKYFRIIEWVGYNIITLYCLEK